MRTESLTDLLLLSFQAHAEKPVLNFLRGGRSETKMSYGDLLADSSRAASALRAMGVGKGDRVILFLDKSLFFIVAYLGLLRIGAVTVPLNPGFKDREMEYLLNDADARLVICGAGQEEMIRRIAPQTRTLVIDSAKPYQELDHFQGATSSFPPVDTRPEDPALIIYTSGTTGDPKGAVLTQGNLAHDALNIIEIWEIEGSDVLCHALPLYHVHGLCFALHTSLLTGSKVVMLDRFTPQGVLERMTRKEGGEACSVFMAVPQIYAALMDFIGERRFDFSHVRLLTSGSAPLMVSSFHRIRQVFGIEPVEREGMSETGMNFSNPYRGQRKPGTIGLPLPRLQARIVDPETFRDVPPGEEGELWLKGPSITPGYWQKPGETKKAFVDGWFRSGDLGKVDGDGYYSITDRLKHIIISGGENISPKEIQGIINQAEGVVESGVVGIPDEKWGEKVVAAVVAAKGSGMTEEDIKRLCKEHLHDWKCPKEVLLVSELPRNSMGKVLNEEIKKLFQGKDPHG